MPQTRWHQMKTIGGLDPFFFLFFPSAAVAVYCSLCDPPPPLYSVGAGMPPCSPQSCHREQFQMFLKPAWACAGVNWEKMGGLQDSWISQCQSYSMSFCLYQVSGAPFYLLSYVFNPGAPLRWELITGSTTSALLQLCVQLWEVCYVSYTKVWIQQRSQ